MKMMRRVTPREAVAAYRAVLRLVNAYLGKQQQDLMVTDGRGLMTWGEIRHHVKSVLALKVQR